MGKICRNPREKSRKIEKENSFPLTTNSREIHEFPSIKEY
jgi:hypothetical protein